MYYSIHQMGMCKNIPFRKAHNIPEPQFDCRNRQDLYSSRLPIHLATNHCRSRRRHNYFFFFLCFSLSAWKRQLWRPFQTRRGQIDFIPNAHHPCQMAMVVKFVSQIEILFSLEPTTLDSLLVMFLRCLSVVYSNYIGSQDLLLRLP